MKTEKKSKQLEFRFRSNRSKSLHSKMLLALRLQRLIRFAKERFASYTYLTVILTLL